MGSGRSLQGAAGRSGAISRALRPAICALLLLAACAKPPVSDELTIEPSKDDDTLLVTVSTTFALDPANDRIRTRVDAARSAAQAETDAWSVRFARLTPEDERVTYQKHRGTLERVTRSARIGSDDLQQVFSDANITVDVLRGEHWRELTFYPGASSRASREQQQRFDAELAVWSESVAHYFTAVHHLYSYLRSEPGRDQYIFAALLNEKGPDGGDPVVLEIEQPFVDAVIAAMEDIAERMDDQEGRAANLAEQADLIFNPFPAHVTIRTPRDVLHSEGFAVKGNDLTIEPVDLFAAIAALEGKWISPDPLAALLRDESRTAAAMARLPRESQPVVVPSEVNRAVREQLARPRTYTVRWRD